jgi:tRNA(Ile)-lysidine synthase TilS/MesJ
MIQNGDIIYFKDNKDFRDRVLNDLLILLCKKSNIQLTNNKNKSNKTAVSLTIDSEAEKVVNNLINKKINSLEEASPIIKKGDNIIIKPLYLFTDEEVLLYAKLKELKYKSEIKKQNDISNFLNNLEKKHPEVKRAVVNGYMKLK